MTTERIEVRCRRCATRAQHTPPLLALVDFLSTGRVVTARQSRRSRKVADHIGEDRSGGWLHIEAGAVLSCRGCSATPSTSRKTLIKRSREAMAAGESVILLD